MGSDRTGGRRIAFDVDAVVFDCDGVLVDSTASIERSWRRWAELMGLGADGVPAEIHGRTSRATAELLLPPEAVEAASALMERMETDDAGSVREVPGALALLTSIPADRWAVVTSGTRPLFSARLAAAGLPEPVVSVTANDVERSKPDPAGYALALRRLGVDPARAVVLEDAVPGIEAARAAGVRWVVRVGRGTGVSAEDAVIEDLRQARWAGRLVLADGVWNRLDAD